MKTESNQAFIDGQNLYFSTAKVDFSWKIDLYRFRVYLQRKYSVDKAYYFIGYYKEELSEMYNKIQEAGFIVVFRKHETNMKSVKKGNVDTDIVFTIMRKIADNEDFSRIVLVSGDGDYFRMVQYLVEKDRFVRLLAPNEKYMSSLYRTLEPKYYAFLNRSDVRQKIELKKRKPNKKASSS